jgi:Cdc6-like AAA superfamily ATPase
VSQAVPLTHTSKLSQAIQKDTAETRTHVITIRDGNQQDQDHTKHRRSLDWISDTDYPSQQSDILERRQAGTGKLFLAAKEVTNWLSEANGTLFCSGIPGAGKTMIAAITIDRLLQLARNSSHGVAYIYCNYKSQQQQDTYSILAALLKQLVQDQPPIMELIENLQQKHANDGTKPLLEEIILALRDVMTHYRTTYIVIDALDECRTDDGTQRRLLTTLQDLQGRGDLRIMVTSRHLLETVDQLKGATTLEVRASPQDVKQFVAGQMDRLPKFVQRNPALQEIIQDKIVEVVDGMYVTFAVL